MNITTHSGIEFTADQRLEAVRLLRGAKALLEEKTNTLICYALQDFAHNSGSGYRIAKRLRSLISDRLGPHDGIYEGWLSRQHTVIYEQSLGTADHADDMRTARLQWIDALIAEFSI